MVNSSSDCRVRILQETLHTVIWYYNTTQITDGSYTVSVSARNVVGDFIDNDSITFIVDNLVPVSITFNATLNGIANVTVISQSVVQRVVLEFDNQTVGELFSPSYSFLIDTTGYVDGTHELHALVYARSGIMNETRQTVQINNRHDISIL